MQIYVQENVSHLELLLLIVGPVVEGQRAEAEYEDDPVAGAAHEAGLGHEEVSGECVEHLDPGEAAPAEVVARPVQGDVQRVEVAGLPVEELEQVQVDQERVHQRAEVEAVELDRGDGEVEDEQRPAQHPEPAVGQLLDVHAQPPGVELDPCEKLIWKRSALQSLVNLRKIVA